MTLHHDAVLEALSLPDEVDWPTLPGEDDLEHSDGEPMESEQHAMQGPLLRSSARRHFRGREDVYFAVNMGLYFSPRQITQNDFRAPDFFAVVGTTRRIRKSWVVWREGGRTPNVVIEFLSESTAPEDRGPKKRVYERVLRAAEYFLFDPLTGELEGFRLDPRGRYRPITSNAAGRLPSAELGLELGVWQGPYEDVDALWLRFFTADGQLVLTPAEAEAARADALEERLRAFERPDDESG